MTQYRREETAYGCFNQDDRLRGHERSGEGENVLWRCARIRLIADDNFALVFDANGTMVRVGKGQAFTPAQHTVLGWEVDDIHRAIRELMQRGVHFEQFNLPFMKQDELGV